MKVIEKKDLKDQKYMEVLDGLAPELAQVVKTAIMETGVREDVLMKLKEMDNSIEGMLLYDFLIEHFYGPEWYGLFEKILKEKENGESYLEILKEISVKNKLSADDMEYIYQNTDSEYGFQQVLEGKLEGKQGQGEKTKKAQNGKGKSEKEETKKDLEKVSADDSIYENFYQEVIKTETIQEEMDQHDQLMAAVIKSNNEYKDIKNRLMEMDRMARMQNRMIIQYKNNIDDTQNKYDELKTAYEQLQNENKKLKTEYDSAMSRLTEINNFTADKNGSKLFS